MSNKNLYWFIGFWIAFTVLNLYIEQVSPVRVAKLIQIESENRAKEPKRQDEVLYAEVLSKIKNEECSSVTDKEKNTFYTCKDGTKVSMINWTRGAERKGVVTREYNPAGQLILIYGHPDDVY